jgi:hypothetical protein
MRKYLYLICFLFAGYGANAAAGDTTWVQANMDTLSWYGNYDKTVTFPTGGSYRNVYMIFTLGKYVCPGSPTYCGDWDYTVTNFLMTPGGDSLELSRLITPYANAGAPRTPWAWKQRYVYDVTDYASKLQGTATIRINYSGYSGGFTGDIRFAFVEGMPDRPVTGINRIYRGSYGYGGATSINTMFPVVNLTAPAGSESAELKFNITGHGSDDSGCCEFYSKNYTVALNNNPIATKAIWRDNCGVNDLYPQSGTWVYDRANWCPGSRVDPIYHKLPGISAGDPFNVRVIFDSFISHGGGLGSYSTEAHVIYHGAFNKMRDASVEDIIAPTTDENHFRANPICSTPTITVKNRGGSIVNLLTFEYGVEGGTMQTHTWSGSLNPLDMADVVLPDMAELHTLAGDTAARNFIVRIKTVNGADDADSSNNYMRSRFRPSPKWDSVFRIQFKTNTATYAGFSESSWKIYNASNTVVKQRTNLAGNTLYLDTVTLAPGCYRFEINDLGCDGLNWWAGVKSGYCLVKKLANNNNLPMNGYTTSGTYGHDFGCSFTQYFYTGIPPVTAVTDLEEMQVSMDVFPNPASNLVNVEFAGMRQVSGTVSIIDIMGRVVRAAACNDAHVEIATTDLSSGVYTLLFAGKDGMKLQSRLVIVK